MRLIDSSMIHDIERIFKKARATSRIGWNIFCDLTIHLQRDPCIVKPRKFAPSTVPRNQNLKSQWQKLITLLPCYCIPRIRATDCVIMSWPTVGEYNSWKLIPDYCLLYRRFQLNVECSLNHYSNHDSSDMICPYCSVMVTNFSKLLELVTVRCQSRIKQCRVNHVLNLKSAANNKRFLRGE